MISIVQALIGIAGRVALSLLFLLSAVGNKIPNFKATADVLASKGLPAPGFLLFGAIVFLIAGSLSVIAGWKTRWGAFLLFVFLLPTTYLFHDFWNLSGQEAQDQTIAFMKNLSMAGAMLILIANGGGAGSLDARRKTAAIVMTESAVSS